MIIFDFDGTLADTISLGLHLINSHSEVFKYKKIDREKNEHLSALELIQYMGVKVWKLPYFMWYLRKKLGEKSAEIQMFPGIKELLESLKASGYKLGILSSNSAKNITDFLKRNNIESYFSYIKPKVPIFGKKQALGKAKRQLKTSFVYVGDELRDVEACRKNNIPLVSVAWGLNSAASLEQANPNLVARDTNEAAALIKKAAGDFLKN